MASDSDYDSDYDSGSGYAWQPNITFCNFDDPSSDDEMFDEGLHEMSEKEEKRYYDQIRETDGFEIADYPDVYKLDFIVPYPINQSTDVLNMITDFAVKDHMGKTGENLEVIEHVKWNVQMACPMNYYITFRARSDKTNDVKTYETKVLGLFPQETASIVDIFREQRKKGEVNVIGPAQGENVSKKRTNEESTSSCVVDAKKQKLNEASNVACCIVSGPAQGENVSKKRTNEESTSSCVVDAKKQKLNEALNVACCIVSGMTN